MFLHNANQQYPCSPSYKLPGILAIAEGTAKRGRGRGRGRGSAYSMGGPDKGRGRGRGRRGRPPLHGRAGSGLGRGGRAVPTSSVSLLSSGGAYDEEDVEGPSMSGMTHSVGGAATSMGGGDEDGGLGAVIVVLLLQLLVETVLLVLLTLMPRDAAGAGTCSALPAGQLLPVWEQQTQGMLATHGMSQPL